MPLTIAQLNTLLETIGEPARIEDATGTPLAQNRAAQAASDWGPTQIVELGDGMVLRRQSAPARKSPRAGAGKSGKRGEAAPEAHPPEVHALARGIAHEIRNPLSSILTAINLVRDDPSLAEETAMLLEVVKKEALRMKRILEEFSQYVRPSTPQPTDFDLVRTVRGTLASLRRDGLFGPEMTIQDTLPADLVVFADELQVGQVLRQILTNAAEAMQFCGPRARQTLTLSGWRDDSLGTAHLRIEDSGTGFNGESLERAFQPFYSKKTQGTGLGLSIARSTVEAAGGHIRLANRSTPSHAAAAHQPDPASADPPAAMCTGATVTIELPLARETA